MSAFWRVCFKPLFAGCDPYNSADEHAHREVALASEMERLWQSCIQSTPQPSFIIPSAGFIEAWYEHLATPDRGHEFMPYG